MEKANAVIECFIELMPTSKRKISTIFTIYNNHKESKSKINPKLIEGKK
jgi:hypothetical protein